MSRLRAAAVLLFAVSLLTPRSGAAQEGTKIAFESSLPRTLVFISEKGDAGVATRDLSAFLREAGFPLVDPALAHSAAQRDLVTKALAGCGSIRGTSSRARSRRRARSTRPSRPRAPRRSVRRRAGCSRPPRCSGSS
jgi:hypothetical protein